MSSARSRTRFTKAPKGGGNGEFGSGSKGSGPNFYRGTKTRTVAMGSLLSTEGTSSDDKVENVRLANRIDEMMGFPRFEAGPKKVGWLINMQSTTLEAKDSSGKAGVDFYFLDGEGDSFKATVLYDPYFLIATKQGKEGEVEEWAKRKFEGLIKRTSRVTKEDLSMVRFCLVGTATHG